MNYLRRSEDTKRYNWFMAQHGITLNTFPIDANIFTLSMKKGLEAPKYNLVNSQIKKHTYTYIHSKYSQTRQNEWTWTFFSKLHKKFVFYFVKMFGFIFAHSHSIRMSLLLGNKNRKFYNSRCMHSDCEFMWFFCT